MDLQQMYRALGSICKLTSAAKELLTASTEKMKLSNRATPRILKVTRAICDRDGVPEITEEQIAEVVQYRTLGRKSWGQTLTQLDVITMY